MIPLAARLACLPLLLSALLGRAEPAAETWTGSGTVFQYATDIVADAPKTARAYLWVPPEADRLRGVLIGGQVVFEAGFVSDPAIRAACAKEKLAILYFQPHLDALFDPAKSGPKLLEALDSLAALSGHPELRTAPWMPYGHSAGTIWTRNILFWKPERCFGAIFFKGGFGVPENHSLGEVLHIPLIHIQGRFEEFGPGPSGVLRVAEGEDRSTGGRTAMAQLSELRAANPDFLMGLFVEDGATHFALNGSTVPILAGFIEAAAAARVPPGEPGADAPPKLVPVAAASGAYSVSGDLFEKPETPAGPARTWAGDRSKTFWHATEQLARAADAFHAVARGKRPQFVAPTDPRGAPIQVGPDMRLKLPATWTGPDTVRVTGTFSSSVPKNYPPVEGPVEHAAGPVKARILSGPLEMTAADIVRVTMDDRWGRPILLFYHPGDDTFRRAEQPANLGVEPRLKDGRTQVITWAPVGPLAAGALPYPLVATSDSGLPVRFYVDHGPARVDHGRLVLADVPRHATWPLRIEVVAWQYGSAIEPKVASAEKVRQTITVNRE